MRYLRLSLTLLGFLTFGVLASEKVHTIHENQTTHCNKLPDILDDNNYELYKELLHCEL